jgi:hypothetical protein
MPRRRRKKLGDPHVRLHRWVMKTAAWQSLTVGPRALLVELYSLHNGSNNGEIFLSERDAANRVQASQNTVSKWFDVLVDRGFIKVAQRGAFSLKKRHATTWILTEFPVGIELASKDFARWSPANDGDKPKSRRGGFRWRNTSNRKKSEIQNTASNIEADSISHCGDDADLSHRKQASQHQTLMPSTLIEASDGIKDCSTGKLPCGADSSEGSKTFGAMAEGAQPFNARSDRGHCIGRASQPLLGWRQPAALRKPSL